MGLTVQEKPNFIFVPLKWMNKPQNRMSETSSGKKILLANDVLPCRRSFWESTFANRGVEYGIRTGNETMEAD